MSKYLALKVDDIDLLKDKVVKCIVTDLEEFLIFILEDCGIVIMHHDSDCCEVVR